MALLYSLLSERARTTLYLWRGPEGPVVYKVPNTHPPGAREVARLRNELRITRDLGIPGVRRAIEETVIDGRTALALEFVDGEQLGTDPPETIAALVERLRLVLGVIDTLGELYRRRIVHRDIKPANLILDATRDALVLIDFGLSTELGRSAAPDDRIEGTLAYISPEQTGRVNRAVDHRADLYSLGATLYEVLTGRLPFTSADESELVHCHIAQIPAPPHEVRPALPEALSRIVMKLLAKDPDERYQTPFGLRHDLARVIAALETTGEAPLFALGERDHVGRLRFSDELHGRSRERAALIEALTRARAGELHIALVVGTSGVGKSALVREAGAAITSQGGHFVEGKFDQLTRVVPYSALIQAFRALVDQILMSSDDELASWRARILGGVGELGGALTALVPNLGLVLGPQPELMQLGAVEAQNQLHYVLRAFVRAVSPHEHPLALFLDDLQWADPSSLKLLDALLTETGDSRVLVVGAYREGDVDDAHPLAAALADLRDRSVIVTTIRLDNLSTADVEQIVADALHLPGDEVRALALAAHAKTHGNAFFVRQFLASLPDRGLLTFDFEAQRWAWDAAAVAALSITDNVVDLMTERMRRLPAETLAALRLAACLGNRFDAASLALVHGRTAAQIAADLDPAVEGGLLLAARRGPLPGAEDRPGFGPATELAFAHDRVQQAAYLLVPEAERPVLHARVGRTLLAHVAAEDREDRLMAIVSQYDLGIAVITDRAERRALAALNLEAGRIASRSIAFAHALEYFRTGWRLLGDDPWTHDYDLAVALGAETAYAAYAAGDFAEVERTGNEVTRRARRVLDCMKAYEALMLNAIGRNEHDKAVRYGVSALARLGETFPASPRMVHVVAALVRTKVALAGRSVESLADLPAMTDEAKIAAMYTIERMTPAAFRTGGQLFPLLVLRMVVLSLAHGNMPVSAFGYATYGITLSGVLGEYDAGYRFGQLALRLVGRPAYERYRTPVLFVTNQFIRHWNEPLAAVVPSMLEAYQRGMQSGILFEALWSACYRVHWMFVAGFPLEVVERERTAHADAFARDVGAGAAASLIGQVVQNLLPDGEHPERLAGPLYDERTALDAVDPSDKTHRCLYHVYKLELCYLFGDHEAAVEHAEKAEAQIESATGMPVVPLIRLYGALARLAAHRARPRPELLRAANKSRKLFGKWAKTAPANYLHKQRLLDAEHARSTGDTGRARELYEAAATAARAAGYTQEEALALELAGGLYEGLGNRAFAELLYGQAAAAYRRWGAAAKANRLAAKLTPPPAATASMAKRSPTSSNSSQTSSASVGSTALDLNSMMKASRAIAREIVMPRLLSRLVEIMVENAGAQEGALLLVRDGDLVVEVERSIEGLVSLTGVPLAESERLSEAIVHYVARTEEPLVLDDAAASGPFQQSPYIQQRRVRSVLCVPIKYHGKLTGVLYLENNTAAGAFSPARCQTLDLLAAQAAISLENAQLYDTLDQRVRAQTLKLRTRNDELTEALTRLRETQRRLVLQEKLASLGALTSGIAHEIKNPLNFVNNFAELSVGLVGEVRDEIEPQADRLEAESVEVIRDTLVTLEQNLKKIHEHGQRVDRTVRAMLEHSRALPGDKREIDLDAVLTHYTNLAHHGVASRRPGIHVTIELSFDAEVRRVVASPQEVCRVFLNLVDNACYAAATRPPRDDGSAPTVRVSTHARGEWFEIRVWDNGAGIPAAVHDRVFTPFFTAKPTGEGTGLGLSISHEIVQSLGGTIRFDTREGEFAEFVVSLPR